MRLLQARHKQTDEDMQYGRRLLRGVFCLTLKHIILPSSQRPGLSAVRLRLECQIITLPSIRHAQVRVLKCRFGYGNWTEIEEFMGNTKSQEEIEDHYHSTYINNKSHLPVDL